MAYRNAPDDLMEELNSLYYAVAADGADTRPTQPVAFLLDDSSTNIGGVGGGDSSSSAGPIGQYHSPQHQQLQGCANLGDYAGAQNHHGQTQAPNIGRSDFGHQPQWAPYPNDQAAHQQHQQPAAYGAPPLPPPLAPSPLAAMQAPPHDQSLWQQPHARPPQQHVQQQHVQQQHVQQQRAVPSGRAESEAERLEREEQELRRKYETIARSNGRGPAQRMAPNNADGAASKSSGSSGRGGNESHVAAAAGSADGRGTTRAAHSAAATGAAVAGAPARGPDSGRAWGARGREGSPPLHRPATLPSAYRGPGSNRASPAPSGARRQHRPGNAPRRSPSTQQPGGRPPPRDHSEADALAMAVAPAKPRGLVGLFKKPLDRQVTIKIAIAVGLIVVVVAGLIAWYVMKHKKSAQGQQNGAPAGAKAGLPLPKALRNLFVGRGRAQRPQDDTKVDSAVAPHADAKLDPMTREAAQAVPGAQLAQAPQQHAQTSQHAHAQPQRATAIASAALPSLPALGTAAFAGSGGAQSAPNMAATMSNTLSHLPRPPAPQQRQQQPPPPPLRQQGRFRHVPSSNAAPKPRLEPRLARGQHRAMPHHLEAQLHGQPHPNFVGTDGSPIDPNALAQEAELEERMRQRDLQHAAALERARRAHQAADERPEKSRAKPGVVASAASLRSAERVLGPPSQALPLGVGRREQLLRPPSMPVWRDGDAASVPSPLGLLPAAGRARRLWGGRADGVRPTQSSLARHGHSLAPLAHPQPHADRQHVAQPRIVCDGDVCRVADGNGAQAGEAPFAGLTHRQLASAAQGTHDYGQQAAGLDRLPGFAGQPDGHAHRARRDEPPSPHAGHPLAHAEEDALEMMPSADINEAAFGREPFGAFGHAALPRTAAHGDDDGTHNFAAPLAADHERWIGATGGNTNHAPGHDAHAQISFADGRDGAARHHQRANHVAQFVAAAGDLQQQQPDAQQLDFLDSGLAHPAQRQGRAGALPASWLAAGVTIETHDEYEDDAIRPAIDAPAHEAEAALPEPAAPPVADVGTDNDGFHEHE